MSMDREGRNTSDNAIAILAIIEKLRNHNKGRVFQVINEDRSKDFSEQETKQRFYDYHKIGNEIAKIRACDLNELKLKAQAFVLLISENNDMKDIDALIDDDCDTQEAAAFSFVRDFIRAAA